MSLPEADARWLQRALELAARGRRGTSPNPMVGAVVVDGSGRLVGEGFHARYGGPHAETVALAEAGEHANGGSLYVSLEPCAHSGKTPPCVDAIIAAGIRRVVVAMRDPNPVAAGGIDRLRTEGVEVTVSGDADGARRLNRRYLTWVEKQRPWVTLKAAVSMDGRTATRTGQSKWITGDDSRRRSLELREEHDAILVGVGTVLADDPLLTRRLGDASERPWRRVVLDSRLKTPSAAAVVQRDPEQTLIAHTRAATDEQRRRLQGLGVSLAELPADDSGRVALEPLVELLARLEVAALLVEGGATVHGSFCDAELVDEVVLFVAPLVIGGSAPAAVAGVGVAALEQALRFRFEAVDRRGDDLEIWAVRQEMDDVHRAH